MLFRINIAESRVKFTHFSQRRQMAYSIFVQPDLPPQQFSWLHVRANLNQSGFPAAIKREAQLRRPPSVSVEDRFRVFRG